MSRHKRSTIAISLVLLLSATLATSFAHDNTPTVSVTPQEVNGALSTQGNQPITVNGVSTNAGATILSGANIETPAGVGAMVNFGALGSLQIDPNTKLTVDFQNGSIRVMLIQGCVVLRTKQGTRGEVDRAQGGARTTDPSKDDMVQICASGSVATLPAAAPGAPGLGAKVIVPMFAGTAATFVALASRSSNPSPITP